MPLFDRIYMETVEQTLCFQCMGGGCLSLPLTPRWPTFAFCWQMSEGKRAQKGKISFMQYETCRHIKEDGSYCQRPALRGRKYCYFHLTHRARRLRRAWALSDNQPYRLQIPPLENLRAVQVALTEVVQGLAAGQLEYRAAGLMLYAIQQATSVNRRIAELEQTQQDSDADHNARLQQYPDFEQQFGIPPGIDLDAETETPMRKADELAAVLFIAPTGQPGGGASAKGNYTREEAYQTLQWEVHSLRKELKEYHQQKAEQLKKAMDLATPAKDVGGPQLPSVGNCGEQPATPRPNEMTYEEPRSAVQNAQQQVHEHEEKKNEKKKAAASATPMPDRLTGSA